MSEDPRADDGRALEMEAALREANATLERRVAERTEELARSKYLLDETGRIARVGGWEIDLRANELSWTDLVHQIHEVEPGFRPTVAGAIGFYAPEAVPVISEAVRRAIEEGVPFDLELQVITARQRRLWVRAVGEAIREDGVVVKVRGVFQDIDARKRADLELQCHREHLEHLVEERTRALASAVELLARSNRDLEQFAYVASHDIQEPLRMVSSFTQLLAKRYGDRLDEQGQEYIGYAVEGAERMQRLIHDLLTYSRVTMAGRSSKQADTAVALQEATGKLQDAVRETGGEVTHGELPVVPGEAMHLAVLLEHLVGNGLKFHRPGVPPRVHVSAERSSAEPGFWTFRVADNGIGVADRHVSRLFVIFQRLNARHEYPGTGIGLALCKRIVERHGGRIWLDSEVDRGTTISFTWPMGEGH